MLLMRQLNMLKLRQIFPSPAKAGAQVSWGTQIKLGSPPSRGKDNFSTHLIAGSTTTRAVRRPHPRLSIRDRAVDTLLRHAWVRLLVTMVALGTPGLAAAQSNFLLGFDVVPATAGAGVARQVSVDLHWPSGCLPTGAAVVGNQTEIARKRTLTIRLDGNLLDAQRCGDIIVAYRAMVSVTPDAEGDLRALVVMNDGVYVGETTIRTRAANSDRSQYDLTGMWYDPDTHGSGLTFIHGFTRNDVLFGTWYVYDGQGVPRWYTIQGVLWKAGGLQAEGQIYETRANTVVCVPPFTGCPVAFATFISQAQARIVMQGPNSAQIQARTPGGAVLFTSNLIRAIF